MMVKIHDQYTYLCYLHIESSDGKSSSLQLFWQQQTAQVVLIVMAPAATQSDTSICFSYVYVQSIGLCISTTIIDKEREKGKGRN